MQQEVLSLILGGGRGSRLFPLTLQRSKPAVPIAGKYRLIDIPISNCLNSDLRRMFVLTQFNSESLNKHVGLTYKFDLFSSAFVSILAAQQTGRDLLVRSVNDPALVDFGRHVIPKLVPEVRVHAYVYRGYWEDVGTIQSYFEANLALCQPVPPFDFYDVGRPVYTHPRFLPATKVESCTVENALVSEGSVIVQSEVRRSLIGIRARVGKGVRIRAGLALAPG